ncbi:hypothetical protein ACPPVU_24710 [Mucilaginibacter sp. McL0603]|uniref:hypothetical protein n=1 Tax=Mucilaginibacter sp. McL0603 TaxID=3415670 RepID=UPI003CEF34D0
MTNYDKWTNFLKPETLKANLINGAFYITLFESFKDYIITSVKDFYMSGFDESGYTYSPDYIKNVVNKNKSVLYASLNWLKESEAINDNDILNFEKQKGLRNRLAHDMMTCLIENQFDDYIENLSELMRLRIKIEKWWIMNVDIPTNSDFDHMEITENDIVTGSELLNKIMMDIITGKEGEADFYYNEFIKNKRS